MNSIIDIDFLQATLQILYVFFEILAIVACGLLVKKSSSLGTILMLIGAISSFGTTIMRTIIFSLSEYLMDLDIFELSLDTMFTLQALSYGLLIIGLFIFAKNYTKVAVK